MPWHIEKGGGTCDADEWAVIKDSDGSTVDCHGSQEDAEDQMAALYANEPAMKSRGAIQSHSTSTVEGDWDGPAQVAAAPNEAATLRHMHAWVDSDGDPDAKSSYKFPHHAAGTDTAANLAGVRNALARLPQASIPESDRAGVERHLRRHLDDGSGEEDAMNDAAVLTRAVAAERRKAEFGQITPEQLQRRASAYMHDRRSNPNGFDRSKDAAPDWRAQWQVQRIQRDGAPRTELHGYASTVNRGYEMWDTFGPYEEVVEAGAFERTLAAHPDVNFLVNHFGLAMARTVNGTLELVADDIGLGSTAFVNDRDRGDVRDLVAAINDRDITEMSFAFRIVDGEWSDDFTRYTIREVDLDRGDVSAVNYGANPFTSIGARAHSILLSLDHLPAAAARAAVQRLQRRPDVMLNLQQPPSGDQPGRGPVDQHGMAEQAPTDSDRSASQEAKGGPSVAIVRQMLELEAEMLGVKL